MNSIVPEPSGSIAANSADTSAGVVCTVHVRVRVRVRASSAVHVPGRRPEDVAILAARWLGGVVDPNPNANPDWLGGAVARVALRAMVRADVGLVVVVMAAAGRSVPGIRERSCRA